jgi:5'-methylthioadenosine phosphorylase
MSAPKPADKIGVIGGSGLYEIAGLRDPSWKKMETPFGEPSDEFLTGTLEDRAIVFVPRHGRGHRIAPHEINHRANVWALKSLGVRRLLSVSAVGSLQERYRPLDMVLPSQYFDRTKKSAEHTFFGKGIIAHVSFADPVCRDFQRHLHEATRANLGDAHVHLGGTYVNMEGPAFSTRAESESYRTMRFDIIGMTNLGEAKLAREAEMCYASLSMVTDYDCWKTDEEPVTVDLIVQRLQKNAENAKKILKTLLAGLPAHAGCECGHSLKHSIITGRKHWPEETLAALQPILQPYV